MRRVLWLASLLLPLGGCYVAPAGAGYENAPPGYPPAGYSPPPYDPYASAYPGYSYNGGSPTFLEGGVAVPLVLFGGEWGYYDHGRHWHRAPEGVSRNLEAHRAGANMAPRPEPGHQQRPGQPGPAAYRPAEGPRPAAAPRPAQAAPAHQEGHERHRDCPPGQHC
jgi:hypothetical protein